MRKKKALPFGLSIRAVTEGDTAGTERYSSASQVGSGSINLGDFADLRGDKKRRRKDKQQDETYTGDEEEYED